MNQHWKNGLPAVLLWINRHRRHPRRRRFRDGWVFTKLKKFHSVENNSLEKTRETMVAFLVK
jgi:hypothetical protein